VAIRTSPGTNRRSAQDAYDAPVSDLWQGVLFCHLLAMAFFAGGQLMLAAVIVPAARRTGDEETLRAIARRFGAGSLVALAVLLATGIAMASHYDLWGEGVLQAKLVLVATVIALTIAHTRYPRAHAISGLIFAATIAIVWLGLEI